MKVFSRIINLESDISLHALYSSHPHIRCVGVDEYYTSLESDPQFIGYFWMISSNLTNSNSEKKKF